MIKKPPLQALRMPGISQENLCGCCCGCCSPVLKFVIAPRESHVTMFFLNYFTFEYNFLLYKQCVHKKGISKNMQNYDCDGQDYLEIG